MRKVFLTMLLVVASFGVFAQNNIQHTVVKDDTVSSLARKYNVTIHDIYQLNPSAKEGIKLGEVILIPKNEKNAALAKKNGLYHKVEPKETLFGIAQKYGVTIQAIQDANKDLLANGLQPDLEILIPQGKKVVNNSTVTHEDYIVHVVQPKETKFALTQKYEISEEQLLKENPQLKEGLKAGDTLRIPIHRNNATEEKSSAKDVVVSGKQTFKDLTKSIKSTPSKEVVIMLPFNISKQNMDSNSVQEVFKKSQFMNITVDFYSGALMAIDDIKALGGNFKITFYDSEETASVSAVDHLIRVNDFSNVSAVIGPLFPVHTEKVASLLKNKNIPVISPLSKEGKAGSDNLYLSVPPADVSKKMMLEYLKNKGENTVAVVDRKKQSSRDFIAKNYDGVRFTQFNEKGGLDTDHLKGILSTTKVNYVILETESSSMVMNTTRILSNLMDTYKIVLVALDRNDAFEADEVHSTTLAKLNLHYPSYVKDVTSELSSFYIDYKNKNNAYPSQYAVRGYDVVYDVLLRLMQDDSFENVAKKISSEQKESRFSYVKSSEGGYYNTGVYILQYDTDLTIKEAK